VAPQPKLPTPIAEPATWEQLFEQVNGEESRRSFVERRLAEEAEALEQFEAWRREAIERLMQELKSGAETRARQFLEQTGLSLEVAYPLSPQIPAPPGGPEVKFLRLALGNALVHVYTSHMPGSLTHVHLLPSRSSSLRKNERLVSEPGAFIVRKGENGFELRYQRGDPEGHSSQVMHLDVLLFRAFRLLVHWSAD
jgi:hypothetical protein